MRIIAHRTTSGVYPQNSIESLLYLVDHGISAIEIDVCSTRDRNLVVAHPGLLNEKELEYASSFADFLEVCNSSGVDVFVDVKFTDSKFDLLFLNSLKKAIFNARLDVQAVIISSSKKVLLEFDLDFSTGYVTSEIKSELFYPWDMLLSPIMSLQKDSIPSKHRKWKLIATEVDTANIRLVQKFNPYAVMTDCALGIQAWMKERRR